MCPICSQTGQIGTHSDIPAVDHNVLVTDEIADMTLCIMTLDLIEFPTE